MRNFDAVIFDWSGTLVYDPPLRERVALAFARLGRQGEPEIDDISVRLAAYEKEPAVVAAQVDADTSTEKYRAAELLLFELAEIDEALAAALLQVDEWPESRPLYPEAVPALAALKAQGCQTLVLSDIHFNIRELLRGQGAGTYIDDYVLSCEHGVQKPDPKIFELALDRLGLPADRVLMVGDRATHDGAATDCGMVSLLLPGNGRLSNRGLLLVNSLL